MAGSGFSCGKSAVEWNVLLYLQWLGVAFTPQFLSHGTLEETIDQQTAKQNRLKNDKRKNYFWNRP